MADHWSSRADYTIGHGDRVMKRAVRVSEGGFSNSISMTGRKRSISYKSVGDLEDRNQHYNKRQHREAHGSGGLNDMELDKDDLRYKLLQKNMVKKSQNNESWGNVDLRNKLSTRTSQPSVSSKMMHPPESTFSTQYTVPEPRDAGITRPPMYEPRDATVSGRIPSSRNTSGYSMLDPDRTYPSWNADNLRGRSPERISHRSTARVLLPERGGEELLGSLELQRSLVRAYGDDRASSCLRYSPSRPVSSSYMTRSSIHAPPVSSVGPPPAYYPQGSETIQKLPPTGYEYSTVEGFLRSLGLEKYAIHFKAEEIDMNALRQLGDNDLKELSIPMGPRKKILQAIASIYRRHSRASIC